MADESRRYVDIEIRGTEITLRVLIMTYSDINRSEAGQRPSAGRKRVCKAGVSVWLAGVLAFVLLIGAGVAYRVAASGLQRIRDNPIMLPVPLQSIPMKISPWTGHEMELASTTDEYMKTHFADDYVSREYSNTADGSRAGVYVVYCSTYPSGLLGHKPDACYPASGWLRDYKTPTETEITTRSGLKIPCLSHQFHGHPPTYGQVFVLSFYVWNGQITRDEGDFSGIFHRAPNISRNPARYVAQVQISSAFEPSARAAARDLVDTILTFLPDRNGDVKAASSFGRSDPNQAAGANR
jgi:hypothetical protein